MIETVTTVCIPNERLRTNLTCRATDDCIYDQSVVDSLKYTYNGKMMMNFLLRRTLRTLVAGHLIGSHTWSHADLTTVRGLFLV
jgi:peptidoglycan/xylan/chitin deacetylase (PgdA/CDA1 family)